MNTYTDLELLQIAVDCGVSIVEYPETVENDIETAMVLMSLDME